MFLKKNLKGVIFIEIVFLDSTEQQFLITPLGCEYWRFLNLYLPVIHVERFRDGGERTGQVSKVHIQVLIAEIFLERLDVDVAESIVLLHYLLLMLHKGFDGLDHLLVVGIETFDLALLLYELRF